MNGGGIPPKPTKIDITSEFDLSGWESKHFVVGRDNGGLNLGDIRSTSNTKLWASGFVDIEGYSKLFMTVLQMDNPSSNSGGCFYDAEQNAIQGIFFGGDSPIGMIEREIIIPPGATYVRTTKETGTGFGPFSCLAE